LFISGSFLSKISLFIVAYSYPWPRCPIFIIILNLDLVFTSSSSMCPSLLYIPNLVSFRLIAGHYLLFIFCLTLSLAWLFLSCFSLPFSLCLLPGHLYRLLFIPDHEITVHCLFIPVHDRCSPLYNSFRDTTVHFLILFVFHCAVHFLLSLTLVSPFIFLLFL
jgi:hypothetical protein